VGVREWLRVRYILSCSLLSFVVWVGCYVMFVDGGMFVSRTLLVWVCGRVLLVLCVGTGSAYQNWCACLHGGRVGGSAGCFS